MYGGISTSKIFLFQFMCDAVSMMPLNMYPSLSSLYLNLQGYGFIDVDVFSDICLRITPVHLIVVSWSVAYMSFVEILT